MAETIQLVVTNRKHMPVPAHRRLREVVDAPPRDRAQAWWARLHASGLERTVARELYAGQYWRAVLQLPEIPAMKQRVLRPWVASAGYGLVGWEAPLHAYSATFSAGSEDSVIRTIPPGASCSSLLQQWWSTLSELPGPVPGESRRVADLAVADPSAAIVVVASPSYVQAMEVDLCEARSRLCHPGRLVVISNRAKLAGGSLSESLVAVDDRARTVVGGSMLALNAKVALALLGRLETGPLDTPTFRSIYANMTLGAQPLPRPKRQPLTDDQVLAFIREELATSPGIERTRLLRKLRDTDHACGQDRFRSLYQRVRPTD
jgi:hypothetical protein